ncbi:MAG: PA0069 family radical SAM protein [Bacteroidia bacterium]|nr:PA0069 family radical SAM protein [Bacteroidia bacterium]
MEFHAPLKGRGAQVNPPNRYQKQSLNTDTDDGLDEPFAPDARTEIRYEHARTILHEVKSPDIPLSLSINPYQGCEHGCIYCYARPSHAWWGMSPGLDFERIIIVKQNAAELLDATLSKPGHTPASVMFSGNTDCYQPIERQLSLTRACLEVFRSFRHPVGMITKNSLITRDIDILAEMAAQRLAHVYISITTLDEDLRRIMEPRTASAARKLETIRQLTAAGIPTGVMVAPIILGLNNHEIPAILEAAADAGALAAGYTLVRLNDEVGDIFTQWIRHHLPDRADKVLNQIRDCHGGSLEEKRFGKRMRGEGALAESVRHLFQLSRQKYLKDRQMPGYDLSLFRVPPRGQLSLF